MSQVIELAFFIRLLEFALDQAHEQLEIAIEEIEENIHLNFRCQNVLNEVRISILNWVGATEGQGLVYDNHEFGLVCLISRKLNLRELDGKLQPNYSSFDPKSNEIDQNRFQIGRFRPNKA